MTTATLLREGTWTPVGVMVGGVPVITATLIPARPGGPFVDINPQWVSFSSCYSGSGATLLAGMKYGPNHWLTDSQRDFFAIFVRSAHRPLSN
ncbi:MAG TPA: hypothetical protein VF942_12250 [Acidimicrobiales bacterium]